MTTKELSQGKSQLNITAKKNMICYFDNCLSHQNYIQVLTLLWDDTRVTASYAGIHSLQLI